ncbi:MAG: hypothetical protein J0H23_14360 [Micrococcales bacterium]|nr:hypothetical protein [Micrococcales bacterium]OJX68934.1 MAG: hypothetical protein BGO94_10065 [Micrococcales bacterium 72-143]
MEHVARKTRASLSAAVAVALAIPMTFVIAAPAQAVCTGPYLSTDSPALGQAKVTANCTGESKIRAVKDWYYTDNTNSPVGHTYAPWITLTSQASNAYLPSGRFHKVNYIQTS